MAVEVVFVSSVVGGFEDVREAAATAITELGLHPLLSEQLSADPAASRRALLDRVAEAEYYLLLVGARYGDTEVGERAPTEQEYDEAARLNKPILVLVQEADLEARQREFLERIRGSWGEGVFYGTFTSAADIGAKVVAALSRQRSAVAENAPAAQTRALELAAGENRSGSGQGPNARVAFAPLQQTTLLDAVALEEPSIADDLIGALRSAGAIPQSAGVREEVTAGGVRLLPSGQHGEPLATIEVDGSITVAGSLRAEGMYGGMTIEPTRLEKLLVGAGAAAKLIWDRIDTRAEIRQAAFAVAILDAEYVAYGSSSSGSIPMGGSIPAVLVVPEPPPVVTRGELDQQAVIHRILAAIRRVFADAGRVQS